MKLYGELEWFGTGPEMVVGSGRRYEGGRGLFVESHAEINHFLAGVGH